MKRRVLESLAVVTLSVGVACFRGSAYAGNLPTGSVKVIPRVSNPVPSSPRPVSSNTRYEGRTPDTAHVQNHTSATRNGTRDESRLTTRQGTERASAVDDRRNDAVCTSGNPKLIGVRCSTNSECNWGARCVGQPARCANTGTPCLSSAQCMLPGVCSGDLRSLSNRGGTTARAVPGSHHAAGSRIPTTGSGARVANPHSGVVFR
jgi:hypothetical protein